MREPCDKRSFRSESAAKLAHKSAHWRIRVYRCQQCHLFHVTNQEKS